MLKFGVKFLISKRFGEEGINSTLKRRTQGIFFGRHDRTREIPYIAKSGGVRGQGLTSQTSSDTHERMNLEDWFGVDGK